MRSVLPACLPPSRLASAWPSLAVSSSRPGVVCVCVCVCVCVKLGTDPMAYGGFIAELGRNPVSKHQIQPEYGDEQADAGRDG